MGVPHNSRGFGVVTRAPWNAFHRITAVRRDPFGSLSRAAADGGLK